MHTILPTLLTALVVMSAPSSAQANLLEDERNTIEIFAQASPAVVFIRNETVAWNRWTGRRSTVEQGSGSGFVWDDRGHVVTNHHVIANGSRFFVVFADGEEFEATIVGDEPFKDLAVLKIEAPRDRLRPLVPGDSDALRVGQKVLAIGNPFGLDQTLTTGVVSALDREIRSMANRPITGTIQTDASINPGNSGGPLLDSSGRLIGVNTAIINRTGANVGIGFAVPVSTVLRVVPQLIEKGRVSRAGLGISAWPDRVAARLRTQGVAVESVLRGSPAERAGLRNLTQDRRGRISGDVIVEIEGQPVTRFDDLYKVLDPFEPGDRVEVVVLRDLEERVSLELELIDIGR